MTPEQSQLLAEAFARMFRIVPALAKLRTLEDGALLAELGKSPGFPVAMNQAEQDMALLTEFWNGAAARWNTVATMLEASEGSGVRH